VVGRWTRWKPARPLETRAAAAVQAISSSTTAASVAGRIESGHLAAGDEIVIMPAQDRENSRP